MVWNVNASVNPGWVTHLWFLGGITLVIMGSGAINCVLESSLDAKMNRTKTRPLPSGRMEQSSALTFGVSLLFLVHCYYF